MLTAMLRNVGGSVMVAIPKSVLEALHLTANTKVNLSLDEGRLVVEPRHKPHYTVVELLAQCDTSAPADTQEHAWPDIAPVGREAW